MTGHCGKSNTLADLTRTVDDASGGTWTQTAVQHDDTRRRVPGLDLVAIEAKAERVADSDEARGIETYELADADVPALCQALRYWHAQAETASGCRLRAQLAETEAHNLDLIADATRFRAELTSVQTQLRTQTATLAAERRQTAIRGGRS